ncbi:MAG: chemotaxis protein CheW [Marinobacter sp.]|uniref:chemotaxis protein CheW n=1 Tax=Marinobacter sp. TaxID=50741 RepID=UPI00299E8D9C|nr:chemotaxis protein CheW [Marinobacter sp.]MDX1635495.1 chemotaxis protein CheW [Marinobacter sp.]
MSDNSQLLPCVMIPMIDRQLLLPNVSIAEVVDYVGSEPDRDAPEYILGRLNWRGLDLPVISYDAANGGRAVIPQGNRGRIIVLNTIGQHHAELPFMAIVTQGIPSQARLTEDQIRPLEAEVGPADLMVVDVDGHTAHIPNLEYLESLALGKTAA